MSRISGNDILIVIKNCHNTQSVGATHSHNAKSRRIPEWVSHRQIDARLITQLNKTVKMRHMRIYTFFLLLATFLSSYAYDFKQGNLYYKILSEEELTVATAENNDIRNPTYSGDIEIPSHVTYNGKTYTVTEIGGFANSPKVTSVTIPETAVKITHFYGGSSGSQGSGWIVKSISGPGGNGGQTSDGESSLKEIRFNAVNCTSCGFFSMGIPGMSQVTSWSYPFPPSVERIIIGPKVTCLPDYAFYLCTKVKSLTIPASITKIGKNIIKTESTDPVCQLSELYVEATDFTNKWVLNDPSIVRWKTTTFTSGLASFINPDAITSTSYSITIPEGFTSIKEETFLGTEGIESIIFPSTLTEIGEYAFCLCEVKSVFAGQSKLKKISDNAFYNSTISSIELPSTLTEIGEYAFFGCNNLLSIELPSSITEIQEGAFYRSGIESIKFAGGSRLNKIGREAFSRSNISSINLPDYFTEIGEYAFCDCKKLLSLQLPPSLTKIGVSAFKGSALNSITFAEQSRINKIDSLAFSGCENLAFLELPASVVEIGESAFYGSSIETLIFKGQSRLNKIGKEAFYRSNISSINLPATLTEIGESAFRSCGNLTTIQLPAALKSIGDYAFSYCNLESVSIPPSCENLGYYAFSNMDNLQKMIISDSDTPLYLNPTISEKYNTYSFGIGSPKYLYIGRKIKQEEVEGKILSSRAFSHPQTIELGPDITEIDDEAFKYSNKLQKVIFPETLTAIGKEAFYGCRNLSSVVMPESLRTIGPSAFCSCDSLVQITLPDGLQEIGNGAFRYSGLKDLSIPNSVTKIGSQAVDTHTINNFVIEDGDNPLYIGFIGASMCIDNVYLGRMPKILSEGSNNDQWFDFFDCENLEIGNKITELPDYTFYNIKRLKTVKLPETLTSIGSRVFENCPNLTSVNLPEGLIIIREYAFGNCQSLESVELPETLKWINSGAFNDCTSLKSISVPPQIERLYSGTFSGCSSLSSVELGESVERIEMNVFTDCPNITEITVHSVTPPYVIKDYLDDEHTAYGYRFFDDEVYRKATLSVPEGSVDVYKATVPWSKFFNIKEAGIDNVIVDSGSEVIAREYYSIDGRMIGDKLPTIPGHYIECLRHADGKVVTNKIAVR